MNCQAISRVQEWLGCFKISKTKCCKLQLTSAALKWLWRSGEIPQRNSSRGITAICQFCFYAMKTKFLYSSVSDAFCFGRLLDAVMLFNFVSFFCVCQTLKLKYLCSYVQRDFVDSRKTFDTYWWREVILFIPFNIVFHIFTWTAILASRRRLTFIL